MKRLVSITISLVILALIYWKIDFTKILPVFGAASVPWLLVSLGMVVPLTLATAWRLRQLMPRGMPLPFLEANRLILLASVLNMVLPSKMGDMAKAAFMAERGHLKGSMAVALVVFEKACDMASLLAWCAFGLFLYPHKDMLFWLMTSAVAAGFLLLALLIGSKGFARFFFDLGERYAPRKPGSKLAVMRGSWVEMHQYFWADRPKLFSVVFVSLGIWFLHLLQIWMFTIALRAPVPLLDALALAPLALLAGLLPLTFAGIGTRDAALILFFVPPMAAPDAAALGVLCTMRYFLPAVAGLPFIGHSLSSLRRLVPGGAPPSGSGRVS
jgi:glycosyltransferase 2 family protein